MWRFLSLALLAGLAPAAAAQAAAPMKLDRWTEISSSLAPTARTGAAGVFTRIDGTDHLMVFGGLDTHALPTFQDTGGLWRRRGNTWSATATGGAPSARAWPSSVWTGHEVIVWGGTDFAGFAGFDHLSTGGKYDPVANAWTAMSETNAPRALFHSAVWTGERMIVWGGRPSSGNFTDAGALYDPLGDSWSATSLSGAPSARSDHSGVWTGERMLIWGGLGSSNSYLGDGAIYDPYGDTWSAMSSVNAPSPRARHVTGWDGSHMFVWGGQDANGVLADGKVYDVAADTWTDVGTNGAPSARAGATVVYDGRRFLIWGGANVSAPLGTGARYDRLNDGWSPITTWNAPSPRHSHVAVWDGARMIVWGGQGPGVHNFLGDGFAYSP